MALGHIEKVILEAQEASSIKLHNMLGQLAGPMRDEVVGWIQELKDGLTETYTDKFFYYRQLPWKAAGMDDKRVGSFSGSVATAAEIAEECKELVANQGMARAHRETVHLWTNHMHTVIQLSNCGMQKLREAPTFGVYVKQKALTPTVNRWVEQAHARVKSIMDDAPNMTPAFACAALRFNEHAIFVLGDIAARSFVAANCFTRNFVQASFPWAGLYPGMQRRLQLEAIYGYGVSSHFRPMTEESATAARFYSVAKAVGTAPHVASLGDETRLAAG